MPQHPASSDAFGAVADPHRRRILGVLARGPCPVNEVVGAVGLAQPRVSKHLGVLRRAGLVSVERRGRQRMYRVNGERLKTVYDWARTFERFWEHQLIRIKERAEAHGENDKENR